MLLLRMRNVWSIGCFFLGLYFLDMDELLHLVDLREWKKFQIQGVNLFRRQLRAGQLDLSV